MFTLTNYTASTELLQQAVAEMPTFDRRIDLNKQTGSFFYDKWEVNGKFKDTAWDRLLATLPIDIGQARLMRLKPESCYRSHADIDDRFHLSLGDNRSYLVDLDNDVMHSFEPDGRWHDMDASRRHSAVNFGHKDRIQLVIRKLLIRGAANDPVDVRIITADDDPKFRFIFDDVFSPWLGYANKTRDLNNLTLHSDKEVSFTLNRSRLAELKELCPQGFKIV